MAGKARSEAEREYNRALSRRIARAIIAHGYTYREVAELIGASENTVYRWSESKSPTTPGACMLAKLCAVLGLDANELLGVRR